MSYAGPASRTNRAPAPAPNASASRSAASARQTATPVLAPRNASVSNDRRGPALFGAGVALGVDVGACMALLFAPQAGADPRRAIARRSQRLGRRGHDAWDDLRIELARAVKRRLASRRRQRDDRAIDAD